MTTCILALSLLLPHQAKEAHENKNPIYRALRQDGLTLAPNVTVKLPPPLFPDGLGDKDQQALIKKIIGEEIDLRQLMRNSPVAPHRLRLREVKPAAPKAITREIEVIFIAYGDLKSIGSKQFLERVLNSSREEGKATSIPPEYLKKRGITLTDEEHEGYGHLTFKLIEKVQLDATGRSFWSETPDSIVAATRIDERFLDDKTYPNQWRPITKASGSKKGMGEAHPYDGAGYYVKITRLVQPKGALLVEGHIIMKEPYGWFQGTNLLRAKLPPVIQNQVRSFRRELVKESGN